LDALSHVIGQVQSKQLLLQHCRNQEQIGRLQLLGMLLGVNEWTQSFHDARLTLPPSCVEPVAMEMQDAVEVSITACRLLQLVKKVLEDFDIFVIDVFTIA